MRPDLVDGEVELRDVDRIGDPESALVVRGDRRRLGANFPFPAKLPVATDELTSDVTLELERHAVVRHLVKKCCVISSHLLMSC